jgi:hypothetical protein
MSGPGFLLCAHCGDRIGVYEPAWLEHNDGSIRTASFLNLDPEIRQGQERARLWHLGCLPPDAIPDAS